MPDPRGLTGAGGEPAGRNAVVCLNLWSLKALLRGHVAQIWGTRTHRTLCWTGITPAPPPRRNEASNSVVVQALHLTWTGVEKLKNASTFWTYCTYVTYPTIWTVTKIIGSGSSSNPDTFSATGIESVGGRPTLRSFREFSLNLQIHGTSVLADLGFVVPLQAPQSNQVWGCHRHLSVTGTTGFKTLWLIWRHP